MTNTDQTPAYRYVVEADAPLVFGYGPGGLPGLWLWPNPRILPGSIGADGATLHDDDGRTIRARLITEKILTVTEVRA